jgi:hypothetical protein
MGKRKLEYPKRSKEIKIKKVKESSIVPRCARRTIAEVNQHSQMLVIGWATKTYYLELHCD